MDALLKMGMWSALFRWTLLSASAFTLSSCWVLMPNCHSRFVVYQEPVYESAASAQIRSDGIYASEQTSEVLYFQPDGLAKAYPYCIPDSGFWANPSQTISAIKSRYESYAKEDWGAYYVMGDSLRMQRFNYHQTEVCKRSVFDYRGVVLNDTTFVITSRIAYWFADTATTGRFVYRFYRTDFKPDDSKIWFEKKRWYLRGRDPSRER